MTRSRTARTVGLLLALTLVAASCGNRKASDNDTGSKGSSGNSSSASGVVDTANCPDNDTDGVSGDTITLASSFPQSGLTAAFSQISKGYKAYFAKVNAAGGVKVGSKSYQIKVVDKDDEYTSSKTVQNINELIGTDGSKAFAVFNVVGTANNVALRKGLGNKCVPNIFAATGAPVWGNPSYPWTIGSTLAPYTLEAKAYADYLKENKPDAKVAMLVQNDDFGKDYEEGFKNAIKGSKITVTQVKSYEAGSSDVASQVTSLKASGADVFFNGATLLACPTALEAANSENWKRDLTFVSGTCISKTLMGIAGKNADKVIAATNIKDPQNPAFADDPAMKEYEADLAKYADKDVEPENGIVAYGYTQGALFVKILESLKAPSRSALMNAMYDLNDLSAGLLIDGVTVNTSKDDRFLAENIQLIQYDAGEAHFNNLGDVLDFEGQTTDLTPADLINS